MEADPQTTQAEFDAALLEALFTESRTGLYILDRELRVVRFNPRAESISGLPPEAVHHRRPRDVAPELELDELSGLAREVLATGVPLRNHLLRGRPPGARPGQRMVFSVSLFRLRGVPEPRRVLGLAAVVEDVTDREAALERLDILHEGHRTIGSTLDAITTAAELVAVAVPRFADTVVVDLRDDALHGQALTPAPVPPEPPMRRAAHLSHTGSATLLPVGDLAAPPDGNPSRGSRDDSGPEHGGWQHGGSEHGGDRPGRERGGLDELRPWLLEDQPGSDEWPYLAPPASGSGFLAVAPLAVHGTLLGLAVFRRERADPFSEQDLRLAGELADRAALNIERAHNFARERVVATTLQRHLLPRRPPPLPAVSSAAICLTAGEGGVWYDVLPLSGGRSAFVVGDVSGRGIEAAAAMGRLRTAMQTLLALDLPPDELLERMDEAADRIADEDTERRTVSCLVAVYDPVTGDCTAASAGHPPPLVIGPGGQPRPWPLPVGPLLASDSGGYGSEALRLAPGSLLALYTDGLAEEGWDPDRLAGVLAHPDREPEELCAAATRTLVDGATTHPTRDAVLLLARTSVLDEDQVALWTLPSDLEVVRTARELTRRQLTSWQLEELIESTELIVSELVTNAIRYGSGPVMLRLIRAGSLWCEVTDGSSTAPHLRLAAESDEGGRGLFLVRVCSRRWGLRYNDRGKTVWSEQSLPEPSTEAVLP